MAPAPRTRAPIRASKGEIVSDHSNLSERQLDKAINDAEGSDSVRKFSGPDMSGKHLTSLLRRRSSGTMSNGQTLPLDADLKQHLKHLGPSNAANKPKTTRINTVKIKPAIPTTVPETPDQTKPRDDNIVISQPGSYQGGIGEGLMENGGREASDGVHSLAIGYGTMSVGQQNGNLDTGSWRSGRSRPRSTYDDEATSPKSAVQEPTETTKLIIDHRPQTSQGSDRGKGRSKSVSTVGSLPSIHSRDRSPPRTRTARSGSISENVVDLNGVKKIVLETTSSSDSEEKTPKKITNADAAQAETGSSTPTYAEAAKKGEESDKEDGAATPETEMAKKSDKKKKRKKRGKKKKGSVSSGAGETKPLLGGE